MGLFDKIFGTYSDRELKDIKPIVNKILELEAPYKALSDEELKAKPPSSKSATKAAKAWTPCCRSLCYGARGLRPRAGHAAYPCSSSAASCSIRGASPK